MHFDRQISIHLMFLFICFTCSNAFPKFIISIHLMFLFIFEDMKHRLKESNFNTSNVFIYRNPLLKNVLPFYFNTSNVFIYPTLLSHFYFLSYPINPYFSTFFKYFPNLRPEISIFSHMSS